MPRLYENELRISDSIGRSFVFSRERLLVHDPSFRTLVAFLIPTRHEYFVAMRIR
jgi:hypothetical protein